MIREDLREEIRQKYEKVSCDHDSYDSRFRLVRDELRAIGDVYSFWIENPELRMSLLEHKTPETIKRMASKGIRQIKNAWYYLTTVGQDKDFYLILSPKVLKYTNALINGRQGKEGQFRKRDVSLNWLSYTPPSFGAVQKKVSDSLEIVNDLFPSEPLGAAIYAHLALALIQPFDDGNKRTSRLIQDRLLVDAGYPPAIIPAGEAKLYINLLEEAAGGFRSGDEKQTANFYNYIASKVNNGLDDILNDLDVTKHD